jgi:phage-related protein
MGDSRKQLREFPEVVRSEIGQAIYQAELGESHPSASPMQGLNACFTAFRRNPKLESKLQSETWG